MNVMIRNGEVITADARFIGDILCQNGVIKAMGANLEIPLDAEVIDATGKYVFPGFIDPHVHIYLPFMGTFSKDDYASGSRAALMGGTTSLIEMCCPARGDDPLEAFHLWKSKADGISSCDYTFHMGVTRFDETTADALRQIVKEGISSFKVFLAYKGAFGIEDTELYQTLSLAKELGVVVTAHCENADLVLATQKKLVAEGKTGPEWHEPSRPISVEAEGCHHLMTFAEATGAEVYVVHTSCIPAVEAIVSARQRGVKAWIETVIPYLTLDSSAAEKPYFEGAKYVMSPPIRSREHGDYLWECLAAGTIDTVATDHAPFDFHPQKHMGHPDEEVCTGPDGLPTGVAGNFTLIPNGIPSIEERVKLLYNDGVLAGKIDLQTMVRCASTKAAQIFGLYPRKGTISPESDADLVIWDPEWTGTISAATHSMATDYSAYEGRSIKGRADTVLVRGRTMVRHGEWVGAPGWGTYLARETKPST